MPDDYGQAFQEYTHQEQLQPRANQILDTSQERGKPIGRIVPLSPSVVTVSKLSSIKDTVAGAALIPAGG